LNIESNFLDKIIPERNEFYIFCVGVLKEKVDQTKVLDIVKGIVEGMIHLHKHNIVHGNLTAKNILLTNEGEPKLSVHVLSETSMIFERFN
jgi:tRNA A-37 threonylcarbamoyl transferase component Bud32